MSDWKDQFPKENIYYQTDNGILYKCDCLEILKEFPEKNIDLVLTDPPYGININKMSFTNSIEGGIAKRNNYKGICNWDNKRISKEIFFLLFNISKHQIIFGGNYYTDILAPTKSWIVWDKKTDDKYRNDFADCELAWCSIGVARIYRYLWTGFLQQNMKNKEKRYHPTQKPVGLIERLLLDYSKENDLILDCFCGSGTTLVAAERLNRRYIGIELEEKYCEITKQRLIKETEHPKLF